MSVDGDARRPTDPAPPLSGEWPAQAADAVVSLVDTVRDRTIAPIQTVARGIVYGLVIGTLGLLVSVLVVIGLFRLLDNWLPTWAVYLILGAVFTGLGLLLWSKRKPLPST